MVVLTNKQMMVYFFQQHSFYTFYNFTVGISIQSRKEEVPTSKQMNNDCLILTDKWWFSFSQQHSFYNFTVGISIHCRKEEVQLANKWTMIVYFNRQMMV